VTQRLLDVNSSSVVSSSVDPFFFQSYLTPAKVSQTKSRRFKTKLTSSQTCWAILVFPRRRNAEFG
jgi:hypothetical protein